MEKIKVLLAEDEAALGMIVKESLETRDFLVQHCVNGKDAWSAFQTSSPDVLVLDVMMPQLDGFELATKIRKENPDIPIIFLTSKSQTSDVLEGFEKGGNDYLKKPFSMEELVVRIKELVRRVRSRVEKKEFIIGQYRLDIAAQVLSFKEKTQKLTYRETQVLKFLADSPNQLVEKSRVLKEVWGEDDFFNGRSLDVFITRLRKKLSDDPSIEIINIRGFGYKLNC
jgi:DNA-binding response OmpR family regulator